MQQSEKNTIFKYHRGALTNVSGEKEFDKVASQIGVSKRLTMDAMSKDELRFELSKGRESVHSRHLPYLELLLTRKEDQERATERSEELEVARDANEIAEKAHKLSKWAIVVSVIALVVAFVTD